MTIFHSGCALGVVLPVILAGLMPNQGLSQTSHAEVKASAQSDQGSAALKDAFAGDFLVGTAVPTRMPGDHGADAQKTLKLIAHQFNAVTPENCMKWGNIHPKPGKYTFKAADALVDFAHEHDIHVFGHNLLWHRQTPDWVFKNDQGEQISRKALIERLRKHMQTVMGRYKGKVEAWDVVNEAISDGTGKPPLRNSKWRQILGDDYLALVYRMAHKIDPKATLIYNDYGWDNKAKRARAIKVLKKLLDQGVPIQAIGIQGHWSVNSPSAKKVDRILDQVAKLGLPIHISELDMSVVGWNDKSDPYKAGLPAKVAKKQARRYAHWFKVFSKHADQIERVSFWGPTDAHSWLNGFPRKRTNYPLLFNRQAQPKPAFQAVIDVGNSAQ